MKKFNDIQHQISGYLEGSLSKKDKIEFEKLLKKSEELQKEVSEMKSFLEILDADKFEKPSTNLKANFDKMLAQEIENQQLKVVQLEPRQDWKSYLRVAASVVIVISAFLFGKYQSNISRIAIKEEKNKQEVLAMLENNSASQRILAVSNAKEYPKKDTKIINAIINRLLFDKNTNVRLAAAEALSKFSKEIIVRDALIKSLETDKNTTVQIEVINILAKIQEKRAIKPMENMLNNEETPQYVKNQLKSNLSSLL